MKGVKTPYFNDGAKIVNFTPVSRFLGAHSELFAPQCIVIEAAFGAHVVGIFQFQSIFGRKHKEALNTLTLGLRCLC